MAMKKIEHVAKMPTQESISRVFELMYDNDANQIKLRCVESRYNKAVAEGDDIHALKEHRRRIEATRELRKTQAALWDYVLATLPEVPMPSKGSEHHIDVSGDCDVRWVTFEEVPDAAPPATMKLTDGHARDKVAVDPKVVESLKRDGDPKNNPTGPGGNAQKHPEPAKA